MSESNSVTRYIVFERKHGDWLQLFKGNGHTRELAFHDGESPEHALALSSDQLSVSLDPRPGVYMVVEVPMRDAWGESHGATVHYFEVVQPRTPPRQIRPVSAPVALGHTEHDPIRGTDEQRQRTVTIDSLRGES
jgi:hypothetical protein